MIPPTSPALPIVINRPSLPSRAAMKRSKLVFFSSNPADNEGGAWESPAAAAPPPPAAAAAQGDGSIWDDFIEIFITEVDDDDDDEEEEEDRDGASGEGSSDSVTRKRFLMKTTIPYYFLRDDLGISEDKMLKISLNFGPVLALSVERSMRPKVQWLQETLKLSRSEVAHIIERTPGILLCSLEDNLVPKMRWFQDELSLSEAERRHVVKQCPPALASSAGSLLLKLDYLREEVGLTREQVKRVVTAMPSILVLSIDNMQEKIDFLHNDMGLPLASVPKLLVKAPALVFQALDTTLKRRVRFLRKTVGLGPEELGRILELTPRVLTYDIEARAGPFLLYLTKSPFRFKKEQVRKMIMRSPSLLAINVSSRRFLDTVEALKSALAVTEKGLSGLLLSFPMALSMTSERIWSTYHFLESFLGCDKADFRTILQRHPQVLGYRQTTLRAKLESVQEIYEVQDPATELRPLVVKYPTLLSYSQAKRIEPRLRAARDAGIPLAQAVTWMPLSEDQFDRRVVRASTVEMDLTDAPLLKQQHKLRKLLRVPKPRQIATTTTTEAQHKEEEKPP